MGLSSQDFIVAFRALSTRACSPAALRKALRAQEAQMVKGRRISLSESLLETRAVAAPAAGELASAAPVDLRGDPAALSATGELFLGAEAASEPELDRIIDGLTQPADPRTLQEVPVPPSLAGYDISWEVGRSRTGSVYRGSKRGVGSPVAVKVFRKEVFPSDGARREFLEKLASGPAEDGSAFIKVLEAREADGHAVVVREFVEGATLETLLAERKISLRRGFEIVGRAAAALERAHARGVAVGRLTTRAIFVQASDHPKIDGAERIAGATPADDVAALGAILYEIAAGTPPYGGFRSHQLKPPSRHNPAAAGTAERIILKALARNPARRYPGGAALAEDIGRFLRHEEVTADVAPSEAALPSSPTVAVARKRRSWMVPTGIAAALALAAVLYFATRSPENRPDPAPRAAPSASVPSAPIAPGPSPPKPAPPAPLAETRAKELAAKGPLKPNEEIDFQFRATGLMTKRQFDELDKLAEEALIRGPESDWAHYYRAFVALERGDDEAALKHADRSLALGMNRAALFELRFDIRLARAEYGASLEELKRLYPKEAVSLANQEIMRLNRELDRDPRGAPTLIRRGALFLHRRLAGRASEDFTRAVAAGESRADYFLALSLKEEERPAEAAEAAKRFLAAHGSLPGAVEAKEFLASLPQ